MEKNADNKKVNNKEKSIITFFLTPPFISFLFFFPLSFGMGKASTTTTTTPNIIFFFVFISLHFLFSIVQPTTAMTTGNSGSLSVCTDSCTHSTKFKILIVNDDGIDAPGIRFLAEALARDPAYDVRVSAPATGQSGVAAKIALKGELRVVQRPEAFQGVSWAISVGGSPVDSLRVGLHTCGTAWRPDMVLSGVNLGNNLGMCTLYSGTVSAALDSVLLGFPTIAFSYDTPSYERPATEAEIAEMGETIRAVCPRIVAEFRDHGTPDMHVANINIPHPGAGKGEAPVLRLATQSLSILKSGYFDTETEGSLGAVMTALDTDRSRNVDPRIAEMGLPLDVDVVEGGDMSLTLTPAWPHADLVSAYRNISSWVK